MKYIYNSLILLVALILISACNDEWKDEQYEQYISFKAPIGNKGCTMINVRYKQGGKVTFQLPVVVSGTTMNDKDLSIHVAVGPDTLNTFNQERFNTRTDLYYKELPSKYYSFPETVNINAGDCTELLNIDFSLGDLDMVNTWVLPLTIVDDPSYGYQSNMRKHYRKALLRVVPFNDYSGSYSTTSMKTFFYKKPAEGEKDDTTGDAMVANTRTAYVVDNNTIFFYAGLMDEDMEVSKRALYKISVRFNEDKSLTLTPPDGNEIDFEIPEGTTPIYSTSKNMDDTRPYIEHRFTTLRLTYLFNDITSAPVPIRYKVTGTLLLERKMNLQIPDEDQQIEW